MTTTIIDVIRHDGTGVITRCDENSYSSPTVQVFRSAGDSIKIDDQGGLKALRNWLLKNLPMTNDEIEAIVLPLVKKRIQK